MVSELYSGNVTPSIPPSGNANEQPSIIIGQGGSYEKITSIPNERLNRTVLVGVKNNRASEFLSNCKLYLQHRWSDGHLETLLLADTFDLHPKGERYVQVASYNASPQPEKRAKNINLCMVHHGFFGYEHMPPTDKKHIVTLKLETPENEVKIDCILWVDEDDKLRLEKA